MLSWKMSVLLVFSLVSATVHAAVNEGTGQPLAESADWLTWLMGWLPF